MLGKLILRAGVPDLASELSEDSVDSLAVVACRARDCRLSCRESRTDSIRRAR